KLDWAQSRLTTAMFVNASDAIIVNGDVYDAAQTQLYRRDASTGLVLDEARLAASVDSTARLQYADGLILVPLHGGRIQALTADTLTTVWVSAALPTSTSSSDKAVDQQLLSSITVRDGKAYFSTAAPDGSDSCGGYVACVSLADGSIVWSHEDTEAGFYWTGAVPTSAGVLTASDAGRVSLLDAATGRERSSVELGTRCRAQLTVSGNVAYAVTTDGVLHELFLGSDGSLTAGRSVKFGSYSTSSPVICDGLLYVGGSSSADVTRGALFVIDLASMRVTHEALVPATAVEGQVGTGDVKSAPLVSVAADGNTYVYFTCNGRPGGVYAYRLGDAAATTLYQPAADLWQYCMSSIACDASGNLYFFNDSGTLFKLNASAKAASGEKDQGEKGNSGQVENGENNGGSAGAGGNAGTSGNAGGNTAGSASDNTVSTPSATTTAKPRVPVSAGNASTGSVAADASASESGSLLDSYSSEDVTSVTSVGDKDNTVTGEVPAADEATQKGLPIWPIVGTCAGAALLVLLLATRRRRSEGDATEGRRG
ncbi:MAG: PQQ-binding-like beta-propeller repeat protein, partial [Coriobacteriaceae bacterium]|nr:PQQ-binding-like beta-propeller repeat protein [Coriobacteriaceae bacterium]